MVDCVFCKIVRGKIPCERVYESENFLAFKDISPKSLGHSLVITKKHFESILDLPSTLGGELISSIKESVFILMKENNFEGFNIAQNNFSVAGQVVPHVHFHIVPRFKDDGLKSLV